MKLTFLPWALTPALLVPFFVPSSQDSESGLLRVQSNSKDEVTSPDLSAFRDRLRASDLDQREKAYEEFVEALRRDPKLRTAARDWREDSDREFAWTARLALRESGAGREGNTWRRAPLGGRNSYPGDMRSQLEEMQRQFGDLDRMFGEFQRRLNENRFGQSLAPQTIPSPGKKQKRNSHSMSVTPDGVKVEIEEEIDGKTEKKTYEAKTLEELYAAHPELEGKLGAHVQMHGGSGFFGQPGDMDDLFGSLTVPHSGNDPSPFAPRILGGAPRTDRLGIRIDELSDADRSAAQIDPGVGLKAESIEPNSIAEKIGLEPGDVVVEVNGRAVKGAPDVIEALAQRKSDQDIQVTIVDRDGKKRVLTWRAPTVKSLNSAREF